MTTSCALRRQLGLLAVVVVGPLLVACGSDAPPSDGGRLSISGSALRLPGISDVEYTLTVRNAASGVVWSRAVTSSQYGDGAGAFSYVGPCDADANPNTVALVIDRLVDSDGATVAPSTYRNPSPVTQTAVCTANADTPVRFDLTLVRAAQQGFFDVAVEFDEVFCSAKLDCQDAFLHAPDGQRGPTAVLGFACASGAGKPTWLYFADDIVLQCGDRTYFIDPTAGPGNVGADPPALFQTAVFRGREAFAGLEKCYWNVAFGLDPTEAPCTLTARATASASAFTAGHSPANAVRPEILWDAVPIGASGASLACAAHPLDGPGSLVHTAYTPLAGAAYRHELACATGAATTAPTVACGLDGGPCDTGDACAEGTCQAGACVTTGQLPDGALCALPGACDPLATCVSACAAGACEGALPGAPLAAPTLPGASPITAAADDSRGLAYLAQGPDGVTAYDLQAPAAPVLRATWSAPGADCTELAVHETPTAVTVYAACGAAGVLALDFTDPAAPTLLATLPTTSPATTLTLLGAWLYLADGPSVTAYDLANPASPAASAPLLVAPGAARVYRLRAFGDRVYALLDSGALVLLDATTRATLAPLTTWSGHPSPTDLAVDHDVVFVTFDGSGFYVLDFTGLHLTAPLTLYHDGGSRALRLAVRDRRAALVYADGRFVTLSLRRLDRPKVLTSSSPPALPTAAAVLRAGLALAPHGATFAVYDFLPFLLASSPPDASTGLCADAPLDLRFSEPLDPACLTATSVTVTTTVAVAGTATAPTPDALRWSAAAPLDPAAYRAAVAPVCDLRGQPGPLVPERVTFDVAATCVATPDFPTEALGGVPLRFAWSLPGATVDATSLIVSTDLQGTSPYYPRDVVPGAATPGGDTGFEAFWTPPPVTTATTFWVVVSADVGGTVRYGQVLPVTVRPNPDTCAGDACPPIAATVLDDAPRAPLLGAVRDALEVGDLVYLAVGPDGLEVRDQSDPTDVRRLAAWSDLSAGLDCTSLARAGDVLFLACGAAGLKAVSVADPLAPVTLGTYAVDGAATSLALYGHALYVGVGLRVRVYDVSDPLAPAFVGFVGGPTLYGPAALVRVVVDGAVLYVHFAEGTLLVASLADPLAPTFIRFIAPNATGLVASDLAVVDGLAWLSYRGAGVHFFDLRAAVLPGLFTPTRLWHDGGSDLVRLSARGRVFTGLYGDGRAFIATARIPTAPVILSVSSPASAATGLTLLSRWLLVGLGPDLRVLDVPPHVIATSHREGTRGVCADVPLDLYFSSALDPATVTATTVAVDALAGTRAVDGPAVRFTPTGGFTAGPHTTRVRQRDLRNTRQSPGPAADFAAAFEVAPACVDWLTAPGGVLAGGPASLAWSVTGLTPDATFLHVSTWGDPGDAYAQTVTLPGVTAPGGFAAVWDVPALPAAPVYSLVAEARVGASSYWSPIARVTVDPALARATAPATDTILAAVDDGAFAYVANGVGLEVHDISDPAHPVVLSRWLDPALGTCQAVAVASPYVFLACGASGAYVLDVTNPAAPLRVFHLPGAGAVTLALYGDALYVGLGADVAVWDVSNPRGPRFVTTLATGAASPLVRVVVADGLLWTFHASGVLIGFDLLVDRFGPVLVRLVPSLHPGASGLDLRVVAGVAYLAYGGGVGLVALDVREIRLVSWVVTVLWTLAPPDPGAQIVRIDVRGGLVTVVYTSGRLLIAALRPGAPPLVLVSTLRLGTPTAVALYASGYVFFAYGRAYSLVDAPLYLLASLPAAGGATCGAGTVELLFSAPVRVASLNPTTLAITAGGADVPGTWEVDGPLVRFTPDAPFALGAHTVSIRPGLQNTRGTGAYAATVAFDVGPACLAFTATPGRVLAGGLAPFAWAVTGGAPSVERLRLSTSPSPASAPMVTLTGVGGATWTTPAVAVATTWYAQAEAVVGGVTVQSPVASFVVAPALGGFTAGPGESVLAAAEGPGGLAYLALGLGFAVRDLSNPDAPVELGRWLAPGGFATCSALAVHGTTVYLACGASGVQVLDVSDPLAPRLVTTLALDVTSLVVVGDALYLGLASGAVHVYDLTLSLAPVYVTLLTGPGSALVRLVADGLFLYLLHADGTVRVFGLGDLFAPAFVRTIAAYGAGAVVDLVVVGGVAYITYATGGVYIVDVRGVPVLLGHFMAPPGAGAWLRVSVRGGVLAAIFAGGTFATFNVVDPTRVVLLGQTLVAGTPTVVHLFSSGYAFWAVGATVRLVDLPPIVLFLAPASALACPTQGFELRFSVPLDPFSVTASSVTVTRDGVTVPITRTVAGDRLTLTPTSALSGTFTLRFSGLANLRGAASTIPETRTFSAAPACLTWLTAPAAASSGLAAPFAFHVVGGGVTAGEVVVGPLDAPVASWQRVATTPSGATHSASWTPPALAVPTRFAAFPRVTTASGQVAGPLHTFTVSPEPCALAPHCDDQNPCTDDACTPYVGCTATPDDANACDDESACTSGDHCQSGACVPASVTSCAAAPCEYASCDPATGVCHTSLAADGAACDDGDPGTAASVCAAGSCEPVAPGSALGGTSLEVVVGATVIRRVFQVGIYAYVALDLGGLAIVDVSDPTAPVRVGGWSLAGQDACTDVVVSGAFAYLTCGDFLHVLGVGAPGAPTLIGSISVVGATSLVLDGDWLYVTAGGRLYVYFLGAGGYPALTGHYYVSADALVRVYYAGGYVYTVSVSGVVRVFTFTGGVPTLRWTWDTWTLIGGSWVVTDLVAIGGYVYVSYGGGGLYAFDVSSPNAPTLAWWSGLGWVTSIGYAHGVLVYGFADGSFVTANVSDPRYPVTLAWTHGAGAGGVAITATYVLVSEAGVPTVFVGAGPAAVLVDVPPYVVAMAPPPGSAGLCGQGQIVLWFSSELDATSIDATTVALTDAADAPVAGTYAVVGGRVTFTPSAALAAGAYHLSVGAGVRNVRGTAGAADGFDADFSVATACVRWVSAPSGMAVGATGTFTWDVDGATASAGELLISAGVDPFSPLATPEVRPATPTATGFTLGWAAPMVPANTVYYAAPRVTVGAVTLVGPTVAFVVARHGCYCAAGEQCESGLCVAPPVCDPGQASCDGLYANGCETLIGGNDPLHCGGCGVTCGGGVCAAGSCQPTAIVSGAGAEVFGLTVDDTHVYWAARGSAQLRRAPKGGGPVEVLASGYSVNDVDVDATHAYFSTYTGGTLHRVPKAGGAVELLAHSLPSPFALARRGDRLVFTNYGHGTVSSLSLHTRAVTTLPTTYSAGLGGLVVEPAALFATTAAGSVISLPPAGGAATTLATPGASLLFADADAKYVYFSGATVGRAARTDGAMGVLSTLGLPYGVAVDDRFIYWSNAADGTINRLAKPVEANGTNLLCRSGHADCDADAANDCEVDLGRDRGHCGACGVVCGAGEVCNEGVCGPLVCAPERASCDGDVTNGCEASLRNDPAHCGGCGVVCVSGTCLGGDCVPEPARASCVEHLNAGEALSGYYFVDPDGAGPAARVAVYCDQETDGGGWLLVGRASDTNGYPGDYEFREAAGAHSLVETDHATGLADAAQYGLPLDDAWAGASADVGVQYYCYDRRDPDATDYWAKVVALPYAPFAAALDAANPDAAFAPVLAVNADGVRQASARFDFFARGHAGMGACNNSYAGQSGVKFSCVHGQQPMSPAGVWMLTDYSGGYTEVTSCGPIGGSALPYYAGEVRLREHPCTDGFANAEETDVDCGGPVCSACGAGDLCAAASDCDSGVCSGGVCQAPTCADGVQNGDEEGFDCGGSCPLSCIGITWRNLVNAAEVYTSAGAGLDKTSGVTAWTAGASSVESLPTAGYLKFTATETGSHRMIGLSNGDSHASYEDIDFAWYLAGGGALYIYEQGTSRGHIGYYAPGDELRIDFMGGQVRYVHNGFTLYTSGNAPVAPLGVDTSLYEPTATLRGAQLRACTPTDPVCAFGQTWRNVVGVQGDGNTLVRDGSAAAWTRGVTSIARFACGQGRLSFTATETNTDRLVGLADGDSNQLPADIDFAVYLQSNGLVAIHEAGTARGNFGAYATGDVFTVTMAAPTVTYAKNGAVFYTSTVRASLLGNWGVDTSFYTPGATLDGLTLTDLDTGGDPTCGGDPFWKNDNAVIRANNIGKQTGGSAWDQGGSTVATVASGDGFAEATVGETSTHIMMGFGDSDTTRSYEDIDFALYPATGSLQVYESGTSLGNFMPYLAGDRLRVEYRGGQVDYLRNNVHFYTSTRPPVYPAAFDVSLHNPVASVRDVVVHSCAVNDPLCTRALNWRNGAYVAATDSTLTCDIANPWNAGAVTREAIRCGHGRVSARPANLAQLMFGLGAGDDSRSYTDLEHAFYLLPDGQLQIYESGAYAASVGAYAVGDELTVDVALTGAGAPAVRYLRNGAVVHTSARVPSIIDNFHLDTSFNGAGGLLEDLALVDDDAGGDPTCGGAAFWTDVVEALPRSRSLKKEFGAAGYTAGAVSQASFTGDGALAFTTLENTTTRAIGLSHGNSDTGYADIDFGIYLAGSEVRVYEQGVHRGTFGAYDPGARFAIQVVDDVVTYTRDGAVFYTSAGTPTYPLRADTSLYSAGATVHDVALTACPSADPACAPVLWRNAVNVRVSGAGATLTRDTAAGTSWNGGASSIGAISCGRGYAEARAAETATERMFGLGFRDTTPSYTDILYAFYLVPGGPLYVYESGASRGQVGTYAAGDVLRVEVAAPVVRYKKNGVTVYTSTVPASSLEDYHLETAFNQAGGQLADLALSDTDGGADPTCGAASFWTGVSGAVVKGLGVRKDAAAAGWDSGAVSVATLTGDGYVEFTGPETSTIRVAGLGQGNTDAGLADVEYGIYLSGATLYAAESGATPGPFGTFEPFSRFRVELKGGVIRYLRGGVPFYRSALSPSFPVRVDTSLHSPGAQLRDFTLAPCDASCNPSIRWQNGRHVTAPSAPSTLVRDPIATAWSAGASSEATLLCGSGRARAVATETTTDRMFGLGVGDSDAGYGDIEFAFYLVANSALSIYESGALVGNVGNYATGDVLEVELDVPFVRYKKNGTVLYTSTKTAWITDAYRLDVSLAHPGATLGGLALIDDDAGGDPTCGGGAVWTGASGLTLKGESVLKESATSAWNAGAVTQFSFTGDGSFEFTAVETGTLRAAGVGTATSVTDLAQMAYGVRLNGAAIDVYELGVHRGAFGSFQPGDRFRIERKGTTVRYLRNGVGFYTSAVASPAANALVGQVALYSPGATVRDVLARTCAGDTACSPPIRWKGGFYVSTIGGEARSLSRDPVGDGWHAGTSSEQAIYCGEGYVATTVANLPGITSGHRMLGLGRGDSDQGYGDIDYAIYLSYGSLTVYENGSGPISFANASFAAGDQVVVEVDAPTVRYWKNSTLLYTSTVPASILDTFVLDTSFYNATRLDGLVVHDATGGGDPTCGGASLWKNYNVTIKGANLRKDSGAAGYGHGASSVGQIVSGNGYVEFRAGETATLRAVGLGVNDVDKTLADIDFAFLLSPGGALSVVEGGVDRGSVGGYAATDLLRVEVLQGVVTYLRNGFVVHTSALAPSYPLEVDTALSSVGATVMDVSLVAMNAALCGNGALNPGETCDDGDAAGGDGCAAWCRVEAGWSCTGAPSSCAPYAVGTSCKALLLGGYTASGVYTIDPDGAGGAAAYSVYCDQTTDGGGWTTFQRRVSASDFYQSYATYAAGFGDVASNYWLGNERIADFTGRYPTELRVDFVYAGTPYYAKYSAFSLGNAAAAYALSVSGFSGNAGDSLGYHSGAVFSTYDAHATGCATSYVGAWWYVSCHHSNLNGVWGSTAYGVGPNWYSVTGHYAAPTLTEMKMRETITPPAPSPCAPGSASFSATGAAQAFNVPAGCTTVAVKVWGAGGGGSTGGGAYTYRTAGGGGGYAAGTLAVTPGEALTVIVGQGGGGSDNTYVPYGGGTAATGTQGSGGGGGRSAVRRAGGAEVITAGGGGGGGYGYQATSPAPGGGASGGASGGTYDGGAGGPSAGGAGAFGPSGSGTPGSAFQGGAAAPYSGGGGGGYWGGGGGGAASGVQGGTGGGGSGYVGGVTGGVLTAGSGATPAGTGVAGYVSGVGVGGPAGTAGTWQSGANGGDGLVVLSWP